MKYDAPLNVEEYTKARLRRNRQHKVMIFLACVVVLCTVYVLIRPAITMERKCNIPEHTHSLACYTQVTSVPKTMPVCNAERLNIHQHTRDCYDADGNLICGYADFVVHRHDSACYDENKNLWCPLPEIEVHEHTESCYAQTETVTQQTHTHTQECFDENGALICELPTEQDNNSAEEAELICNKTEVILHEHTSDCFDDAGNLICGKIQVTEHQHTDACYETVDEPVDTEALTCTLPEDENHTHSPLCYGTWKLICGMQEHRHSEACQTMKLTEKEQAQAEKVIALIDALPTSEEIEETLAAYDEAEDYDSYEAYFAQVSPQVKAAYIAYDALTDAQEAIVSNADKLMELEWIWSAATFADTSTIEPLLNGDYAYLTDVKMKADEETESGVALRTGTNPFDANDEAGNDSTTLNNVLRTFDTATYTIQFSTKLREKVQLRDISGYEKGRLYFEFILPASAEKAQFEVDSMGWLQASQEITYEIATLENGYQVLRGSFMLVPNDTNPAAIGASTNELTIVTRALQMHNGDTLKPAFTLWLEYNDVGTTYSEDGLISQTIVTGTTHKCAEQGHGQEFATVTGPAIRISAAPRYNIALTNGDSRNTAVGTYDFNATSNKGAINYGLGKVYGRLSGYGIRIELRGKSGQGMRGIELPDESTPITFDLSFSSVYKYGTKSISDSEYRPLFWSGGGNESGSKANADGRTVSTQASAITSVPNNKGASYWQSCKNGGTWSFTRNPDDLNTVHVSVSGFVFDPSQIPYTDIGGGKLSYSYYNPNNINNYWDIEQAVFSAGELWVVQPYNSLDSGQYIVNKYGSEGSFYTTVKDSNMYMKAVGGAAATTQTHTNDDSLSTGRYLKNPGNIDAYIYYLKYKTRIWNDPLTEGAYGTDNDWAAAGQGVTLESYLIHDGSEGDYQGVAYDLLIKFDDEFFEPDGTVSIGGPNAKFYWAAKPDGSGWVSDDEMKQATEDDLVYYTSLSSLKAANAVPVGLLEELRGVSPSASGMNHYHVYIDGKIKMDCPANKVYMLTRTSYAWNKANVAQAAAAYCKKAVDDLTDADYTNYAKNAFPSKGSSSSPTMLDGSHQFTRDYPAPFWRQDYYICSGSGEIGKGAANTGMLKACYKASYGADGAYKPGYGVQFYEDSCLVVPYETTITKATAQKEQGASNPKKVYDMGQNQRTADFVLYPRIDRTAGESTSTSSQMTTTIYIKDTLPHGLTYISGSSYLGGSYTQDPLHQKPGVVTDGQNFEPTVGTDSDGNITLTWQFEVNMDFNDPVWTQPFYFSCTIGTPGNEDTDVVNQQQLKNQVVIWSANEQRRPFDTKYGNKAEYGIEVLKTDAVSLSKLADQLVVDWWNPMGFTMNIGNNSGNTKRNTVIVETLPYNGINGTVFHGNLLVTEFSAGTEDTVEHSNELLSKFTFYYTTDEKWAGCTSDQFLSGGVCSYDFAGDDTWTELTLSATANTANGRPYGLFENFPDESAQGKQITAIVAVGDIPPNETLKMHITLKLPAGMEKDYLVNYLSQDMLTSYARTQVVNRTLEGLTWMDTNGDGIQGNTDTEERISGVQVSLWKLKDGGDPTSETDYEPFCYPKTKTPIVLETGQTVSVQAAGSAAVTDYEQGRYKFTDLPAGTFAVKFTDGSTAISPYIATSTNRGSDDTMDSDGVAIYSSDRTELERTVILGIEMQKAEEMTYAIFESKNHDSGFYVRGYELPDTGGVGTELYITVGCMLTTFAAILLLYRNCKRRKEDSKLS